MKWAGASDVKPYPVLVRHGEEPLLDSEINAILRTPRVKQAFIQIVDEYRQESFVKASSYAGENNPLGMARELGNVENCNALILSIEKRVEEKSD